MTDDWQWFWAGISGRDRILRDEVEGLHARLSSASSQTHRLSSQLATLSGSIESRLNALSAAWRTSSSATSGRSWWRMRSRRPCVAR